MSALDSAYPYQSVMRDNHRSRPERRAVALAFACNFALLGSYYILRPVRDTLATVVGVGQLQKLFTITFLGTILASWLYSALASRVRLVRLLPGAFWFWLVNILTFAVLFRLTPGSVRLGSVYYVWFSVVNLFMISVFWSLVVDVFSAAQALRSFATIAAGGALGAIAGPLITRSLAGVLDLSGLMLLAACGFALTLALIKLLMREKERLRHSDETAQHSTLSQPLAGSPAGGLLRLLKSPHFLNQAAFMLLMTWVNTVAYFCQTDLIARNLSLVSQRTRAVADIDLIVNLCTAVILLAGVGRFMRRFGLTASLTLNPILMLLGFAVLAVSPTMRMIQGLQVIRRVSQYAIARPSREVCFTVVDQSSRYKAKNFIDTVVYRFGDMSSAWLQSALLSMGYGIEGAVTLGAGASILWGTVAVSLGRRLTDRGSTPTDMPEARPRDRPS